MYAVLAARGFNIYNKLLCEIFRFFYRFVEIFVPLELQDPILLTGTLRSNLDPWNTFSDDEIWPCLEKVTHSLFI